MADCGGENVVMEETMRTETDEIRDNLKYLTLLSRDYPSQAAAASEIISTQALLKLPKGTEHFMSDLHGENEAFVHILNSASGVIREKVDQVLGDTVTSCSTPILRITTRICTTARSWAASLKMAAPTTLSCGCAS